MKNIKKKIKEKIKFTCSHILSAQKKIKKVEYGVSKCAMIKVDMVVVILFFINIYSGDKLIKTLFYFFQVVCR